MAKPFIVLGDKTSHGGAVVAGSTASTTGGKPIARMGDKISCPAHGSGTITSGDSTVIIDGKPVARHGDKTSCGATLVAGQMVTYVDNGSGGSGGKGTSQPSSAQSSPASSDAAGVATQEQAASNGPQDQESDSAAHAADQKDSKKKTQLVGINLPGLGDTYLDKSMAPKVKTFIEDAAAHGVHLHFNSAFRTSAHQAALHNDPNAITPATHSLHSCGFAVDVNYSVLSHDEQRVIRSAASKAGLKWGGDFHHPDPPHFYENPPVDRTTAIQNASEQYQQLNTEGK